jgi:DNA repair protein RecN (Recombination protein N)
MMPGAAFSVRLHALAAGPQQGPAAFLVREGETLAAEGAERVEFDLAANPGEGARPLARVASGGELSRIMLALRHVAGGSAVPTLVFDEVDSGIGGAAAEAVGRRLFQLGRHHQVLCITHLAQIAAFADAHYRVGKETRGGRTRTWIERVEGEERINELARMLGGDASGLEARGHAAEMLRRVQAESENEGKGEARSKGRPTRPTLRAAAASGGGRLRAPRGS